MELEDLKQTWRNTTSAGQSVQNHNPELLNKMKGQKFISNIRRITIPETIGILVCLAAAVFIGVNFFKLDTPIYRAAGVMSILLLLIIPIISYQSTAFLSRARKTDRPYAETLVAFARHKIRFVRLQKLNAGLGYLLLVCVVVLMAKLSGGRDLAQNKYFWIFSMTIGYIFLMFYARWVEQYYRRSLATAEELLDELAV